MKDHLTFVGAPPSWGYNAARALSGAAFGHKVPLSALRHAVAARARKAGEGPNWAVIEMTWGLGHDRQVACYDPPPTQVLAIRRDLAIKARADFYFVENGRPVLAIIQPRRSYNPSDWALALWAALLRRTLVDGHFAGASLEIFDFSDQGGKTRVARSLTTMNLPGITDTEVDASLQLLADAYDDVARMGIDWEAIREARRARAAKWAPSTDHGRPGQSDMFGG
ncbi:MAG: hypothetical protein J0H67_04965 [Rhodospirillales bacterium]|nr:hypothetical protein [Rhodospirillales bacterium]